MIQGKLIVKNNILICDINGVEINIGYCINQKIEQYGGTQAIWSIGHVNPMFLISSPGNERITIEYEPCQIEPTILESHLEM